MLCDELLVLCKILTELLDKDFIGVNSSSVAISVLFVKKSEESLRFCIDYRDLNKITKKDQFSFSLIYEILGNISQVKGFTKLDMMVVSHRIGIAEDNKWKTMFCIRYGLYEGLIISFGFANMSSTFQKYINWPFQEYLDKFCSVCIDDVLIYSNESLGQYREYIEKILNWLCDMDLQLAIDKYEFKIQSTKYLGFIIEAEKGICMNPEKVSAILNWQVSTIVKGVGGFLGFLNFYGRFIDGFSEYIRFLTEFMHTNKIFQWMTETEKVFENLKKIFMLILILVYFDYNKFTRIETDSLEYCIGDILQQQNEYRAWISCAFYLKKNNSAKCNYEIHDKKLLIVIWYLDEWNVKLCGIKEFEILTDHKNLEYFMTVQKLIEGQMK